jgi:AraC-like DNA-binding protein
MTHGSAFLEEIAGTACVRLQAARTGVHANLVPCIVFGRDRPVSIESACETVSGDAVLVDANWAHSVNFHGGAADVIYLERWLTKARTSTGARSLPTSILHVLEVATDNWSVESATCLADMLGTDKKPIESGIAAILNRIKSDPMMRLSETDASRIALLERTTMLKRFKHQTGMTFRAYKNWTALKHATRLFADGCQIGSAGLDSGFADAGHFSRQFRSVFGLSPTEARECLILG